jgi:prolyl oligopeptidase
MKSRIILFCLSILLIEQILAKDVLQKPPLAKVEPVEEVYFGVKVNDPYQYMENLKDEYVEQWFKAQADYARAKLNSITKRQFLIDKMYEFDNRRKARYSTPRITENDLFFFLKTRPGEETGKLYYRYGDDDEKQPEYLLYDPGFFSSDTAQKYVISGFSPSYDGSRVVIGVAPNGSENTILFTMDVKNRKLYPEQIDRCWGAGPCWLPDGSAFLYNRLQSSDVHDMDREKDSKVYLHVVGTDPSTDKEIFSREKYPEFGIKEEDIPFVDYWKDSKYIFGFIASVDNRLNVLYAPAEELYKDKIAWKRLFEPQDEVYGFDATEEELYIFTPKNAPNFKLLKTSLKNPDIENAEVVIPEPVQENLRSCLLTKNGIYYTTMKNGVEARLFYLPYGSKNPEKVELPFPAGKVSLLSKGFKYDNLWVIINGWTKDYHFYRYLPESKEFVLKNASVLPEYPEYSDLVTEELMVPSHDGVKVPLSLIYKKGMKKDGKNRVLIYGYGAYGNSINPFFSSNFLLWTHEGGILAIAHVRGGGELGDEWRKGGFKTTKPNTWKDLIACAEYLIKEEYTSSKRIAITGGSAGGILIGRAMTERPDLFAAAIPSVGCMNPLRAEESPNGPVNVPEFGTVKDSVECMALIEMDSYLHIEKGTEYPAALVTAGINDPRVIAWQPAKFAAKLQACNTSDNPILFWVDYEAGHGIGDTKSKAFESLADELSFALWQTGHPEYKIK